MKSRQQQRPAAAFLALVLVVFLIPPWIPVLRTEPWEWVVVVMQAALAVAMVVYLVKFVRKQRDDYWREHGKDRKLPET
ncbi:Ca2+/H+ antiporter [Arthrobacter sp. CAN_A212]|uniref:hypothetical protein n=1 Tax=Arthrobacter sp. CAN_A212 TaxID=2787719 RepID=UPI0018C93FB4